MNTTIKKYGAEQVRLWRRSYDTAPPGGESLKDVCKRVSPFYKKYVENRVDKVRKLDEERIKYTAECLRKEGKL